MDETLIYFKFSNEEGKEGTLKLRPGVFTFLEKISEFYEIILFAEASEAYIKLTKNILIILYIDNILQLKAIIS